MKRLSRLTACLLALTLTACTAAETAVPAATSAPTAAPAPTETPTAAPQSTPLPYDDLSYVPEFGFQEKQTYQPDEYNRLYLDTYSFNDRTVLVGAEDETAALLEAGKGPGLGVRSLQARGITGQGVKIAVIDQSLLTDHPEISGAIAAYCETGIDSGLSGGRCTAPPWQAFWRGRPLASRRACRSIIWPRPVQPTAAPTPTPCGTSSRSMRSCRREKRSAPCQSPPPPGTGICLKTPTSGATRSPRPRRRAFWF